MLLSTEEICSVVFCREIDAPAPVILEQADCTLLLNSSGRAAAAPADNTSEALWLEAGALLLFRCRMEITPATDCHLLAIGFSGTAARQLGARLDQPLLSDCNACPLAAQEMSALSAAVSRSETELLPGLAFRALCSVARADEVNESPSLPPLVAQAVVAIRQNYAGLYGVDELARQLGVSKSHLVRVFTARMGIGPGQYLIQTRVDAAKILLALYGVDELARQLGVSKSHLVRVFTARMGIGPGQYLIQTRVDAAKILLAQRDYSLDVVASLCGFSGANYLCKVFKKHTGQTPGMFRALHAGSGAAPTRLSELESALYT